MTPNRGPGIAALPLSVLFLLVCPTAHAHGGCDPGLSAELATLQRFAHSVPVDKPGLARVYAADGTEFTAGQALWMKGQVREVEAACARGDRADAAQRLDAVSALVQERHR